MQPSRPRAPVTIRLWPLLMGLLLVATPACSPTRTDTEETGAAPEEPAADPAEGSTQTGSLEDRVTRRLEALDARTSLYAKHLPTGREIALRADVPMNTLSVIKVPIMARAFLDHAEGEMDLDSRVEVTPEDMRRGSGLLQTFAPGLEPTLRDLVTQMIITSDNTATDMVIRAVGMERVNALLEERGYDQTRLKLTTGDLFLETWTRTDPALDSMSHRTVYERGFPSDEGAGPRFFELEGDSTVWLGRTTAREMGRFLEEIHDAALAPEDASQEMLAILGQQFYTTRLPRRVRFQGVNVAHKTGDWPPYAGNDVGILFYEGGPTIISVFTNQNRGDFFELEDTLGRIAEDIVSAWK
ncbi:MAG: serine hydrolase [Gemmatimonadetes bacterium]|nr:serine hydrolase [Gemmatimonadota bacterium]